MNVLEQIVPEPAPAETLPSHLLPLVHGEWGLWRWFVLRGTGFPVDRVAALSFPDCASAADCLLRASRKFEDCRHSAIQSIHHVLDQMDKANSGPGNVRFKSLLDAVGLISAGKAHFMAIDEPQCEAAIAQWKDAKDEQSRLQAEFDAVFAKSLERQSKELHRIAADPLFQEALIWQNRQSFENGLKPLLERHEDFFERNKKDRQREELVANYLQRYCLKSETIGFFGPVCWGMFRPEGPSLELVPGKSLLRSRQVYFEDWAISSLAASLSLLPEVRWWTAPALAPYFHIEEGAVYSARTGLLTLDKLSLAVVQLCNGTNLPFVIQIRLSGMAGFQDLDRSRLMQVLDSLVDQGILSWGLHTPIEVNAENGLRAQLRQIGDPAARQMAFAALDRLESLRTAIGAAAGEPEKLNSALKNLDSAFEEITNCSAQRNRGSTYAARTLVYEDCRRDLAVYAGVDLLRPILPALSLLLKSLRWFVHAAEDAFRGVLQGSYRELAAKRNKTEVPAAVFAACIASQLSNAPSLLQVEQDFHEKWASILPRSGVEPMLQFRSVELRKAVDRAFPDLWPDPQPVLYYCPDLMIGAADEQAIRRGEALYVLGELHVAKNTLTSSLFVEQHPCKEELVSATAWDCAPGTFRILPSRKWQRLTVRTNEGLFLAEDYLLAGGPDAVAPTGFTAHPIRELVVEEQNGRLAISSQDHSRSFDVLEAFADLLFTFLMHKAAWLSSFDHSPRIAIDNLVIQRESWRYPAAALAFALEKQESIRFLGARRWREQHNLPEKMFAKTPLEPKPFYVDMSSPIYVEILCKMVRRLKEDGSEPEISFSEMLPPPPAAWLTDANGARYASEFRFALVDLKARQKRVGRIQQS